MRIKCTVVWGISTGGSLCPPLLPDTSFEQLDVLPTSLMTIKPFETQVALKYIIRGETIKSGRRAFALKMKAVSDAFAQTQLTKASF